MHVAGADTLLGPEMRSTGEVMGIDSDFSKAYAKAALAAGQKLPASGNVFVSMTDKYKEAIVPIAKELKVTFMFPFRFGCVYVVAALKPSQIFIWPSARLTEFCSMLSNTATACHSCSMCVCRLAYLCQPIKIGDQSQSMFYIHTLHFLSLGLNRGVNKQ